MYYLFSYGTLQQEQVRITDQAVIKSSGKEYHPILIETGNHWDKVEGSAFLLTEKELEQADEYEVDDYKRQEATLVSGTKCFIYVAAD